jgi:hypothetical protein
MPCTPTLPSIAWDCRHPSRLRHQLRATRPTVRCDPKRDAYRREAAWSSPRASNVSARTRPESRLRPPRSRYFRQRPAQGLHAAGLRGSPRPGARQNWRRGHQRRATWRAPQLVRAQSCARPSSGSQRMHCPLSTLRQAMSIYIYIPLAQPGRRRVGGAGGQRRGHVPLGRGQRWIRSQLSAAHRQRVPDTRRQEEGAARQVPAAAGERSPRRP